MSWVPTQLPISLCRLSSTPPSLERVVAAAFVMKRVVIGAPPQRAAGDLALIGRVDEVALVVVLSFPGR